MPKKKATKKKAARKPYSKATGRSYAPGSYDHTYNNTPVARRNRAARMRALRAARKKLVAKHGAKKAATMTKGKELDHKRALSKGGSNNASNTKFIAKSANRAKDRPMGPRKKTKKKKT